jgi:hypothetical protein
MLLVLLAGCGGSEASASPSAAASASAAASTAPVKTASAAPTASPAASATAGASTTFRSACTGVAIRRSPASDGKLVVRMAKGTKVRVVETVTGDPYAATSCGTSGDTWAKVDRVNGKSIKKLYGVSFGYIASGFLAQP